MERPSPHPAAGAGVVEADDVAALHGRAAEIARIHDVEAALRRIGGTLGWTF